MEFLHYDVWTQGQDAIEVALSGNAANVLLLDDSNFQNYKSRRQFNYHGGFFKQSPVVLRAPGAGHWHVVIDLGGGAGRVSASVRVLSHT
jgi:hypothetical protein